MRAPRRGDGRAPGKDGVGPPPRDRVEHINVVIVHGALATPKHDDAPVDECRRVRAARRRDLPQHLGVQPLHRLCSQSVRWDRSEEDGAPVLKRKTSRQQPFSSHPPKSQATLSTSVTLCARMPCDGSWPYTDARLQYISVAGTGSASFELGRWGVFRILCPRGPVADAPFLPSLSLSRSRSLSLSLSRSRSFFSSRSFSFTVAGDPDRVLRGVLSPLETLAPASLGVREVDAEERVRPDGFLGPPGILDEAPAMLLRLLVLATALKVDVEPECPVWKYGERGLARPALRRPSSGTSLRVAIRGESIRVSGMALKCVVVNGVVRDEIIN